ncbi:hypothetical protein BTR14_13890 [Rhizobium rhizosphaerae]|uniref:Histidine-type phosphatase n=2 Tax=Xaviernesmea rhizosphaerae TaxID=1672749 RepID=A0ABX3PBQ7_9HYPH|nr:hypothetical protein BTR14_13890 [Xaviernesmea rhizosphaerae]
MRRLPLCATVKDEPAMPIRSRPTVSARLSSAFVALSLCAATALPITALSSAAHAADGLVSDKMILLMRHGVRPQTDSKELAKLSPKAWPTWDVADGQLTAHGIQAVKALAPWQRGMLAAKGLVPAEGCPVQGTVFGWANRSVQRTIDTGKVLLATMFPGCGLGVGYATAEGPDPLYDASETELGAIDVDQAKEAILKAAGGSFDGLKARAAPLLKELDAILGCETGAKGCPLSAQDWQIDVKEGEGDKPASVSLKGPLAKAGTLVQVFLLQYANGFPADQVAFGKASTAADIIRLSELRQLKYDVGNRVPYLAARDASNFLNQILIALAIDPTRDETAGGPPNAKVLLFMGSDTQQAEIAAILGLHWHIPPYLDDETPPTGALSFERLHDAEGKAYVRLGFTAPSLDQIRTAGPIDAAHPPIQAISALPGCEAETVEGACPLETFLTLSRPKLDMTAVAPYAYE